MSFKAPNEYREVTGNAGTASNNPEGMFYIPIKQKIPGFNKWIQKGFIQVVASPEKGWEHLTVCIVDNSKHKFAPRTPTWEEMMKVKHLFWDKEDIAIQMASPLIEANNLNPLVLHWWKKIGSQYEEPTTIMIKKG